MRSLLIIFFVGTGLAARAQTIPLQTFISGGAATHTSGANLTAFSNFGQPMVFARPVAGENGGGLFVVANIMFSVSTVDNEDPGVSPGTLSLTKGVNSNFQTTATDNIGVNSVYLFHRPIAAGGTFDSTAIPRTAGTNLNGTYSFDVPPSYYSAQYDDMGMEYYVKAFDSKNTDRAPATGVNYAYAIHNNPQVPAALLSYGIDPKNYRIIAVPFAISGAVSQAFTDLPASDKTKYRFWEYESGTWTEYPDFNTLSRGTGYFIIMSNALSTVVLKMGSQQTAPTNNRVTLFSLNLNSGWNLIGNPYPVDIDWNDIKTLNNNPTVTNLKIYNSSGNYTDAMVLRAFEGAFVKVTGSAINLDIGFDNQTTPGGRKNENIGSDLASSEWNVPVSLHQGEIGNDQFAFGMRIEASKDFDRYDDFYPPSLGDYIQLDFPHGPELGAFSKDIVNTQNEYVWRFKVGHSRPDDITLSWSPETFGDNDKDLFLYDMELNRVVNMREANSYTFGPENSKDFQIYFGKDMREKIRPDGVMVSVPTPNPFRNSAEFNFALPGVDNIFSVELQILNGMGQPVKTLVKGILPSGLHKTTWNGTGDDGEKTTNGLYYYRMRIDGKESKMWNGRIVKAEMN